MSSKQGSKNIEIKDYILKEDIGEGNFGKVKLGISKITGEKYAVKIINKNQIKIKMKNKIFRENEVITRFNHINVIFVFEIIEDPENYYIIMEYCKKGELFDYIVEKERLSEDEASIFFYQLINGVEYIHSMGIAHRDLKPENLLLTKDKTLKIIDFGLSHEFDGINLLKTKCGSPSYASPEILRGKPYDGFKTDVWCCGIILYAMVCGYLPFDGDTNKILFKNIIKCEPDVPDYLNDFTQDLIIRILTSDPDMRITIDEIKKHRFYLRGKKLCHIDYKMIEKNVLKKRKNKSSFKLNEDDNTYFIAENNLDFNDIKKKIISREEKMIHEIINEAKNEKKGKKEKIKDNKENNNNKTKTLSNITNKESHIYQNNSNNEYLSNDMNNKKQSGFNNRVEIESFRESNLNDNNKSGSKKGSFNQFNNKNEMDEILSSKRLNTINENINSKNNNSKLRLIDINNNKIEQINTPKNNNKNNNCNNFLEQNNKTDKFNEFLLNVGKNLHINTFNNDSKIKILKFNKNNNNDQNQHTLECNSPKTFINKYNPTITINGNNHNSIFNNTNNNRIFDKIKNNFNRNFFYNRNYKRNIFFNNFKSRKNKDKNKSNENSHNINNEIGNEHEKHHFYMNNNDLNNNNLNKNNHFKNKKSPDKLSLHSFNQIKLINIKPSNKDNNNLYYNNINININNFNVKQDKILNDNYIPNLNYMNTDTHLKNKFNKKNSLSNFHNSKQLYLKTENNKHILKIKKLSEDNKDIISKNIPNNNFISKTNTNSIENKKIGSKTQENFYKPKKHFNFDKISFRSSNDNKNKKNKLQFKNNLTEKNEKLSIRGGSEGRPTKHSNHLDHFLQTITANGFYKKRKGNKKIYLYGPINIKVNNNNYNVNNQKHQFLPIMFKK